MSTEGASGKKKHVTLNISQKPEIGRLESGNSGSVMTVKRAFSDGQLRYFKECHGITELDIGGEVLSPEVEA